MFDHPSPSTGPVRHDFRAFVVALTAGAAAFFAAPFAHADRNDGAGVEVHALTGMISMDRPAHAATDEPDALAGGVRFNGSGRMSGGGVKVFGILSGFRLSFEESFFTMSVPLEHGPVSPDYTTRNGNGWGFHVSGAFGRHFEGDVVSPYVDLHIGAGLYSSSIKLSHVQLGGLGETNYSRVDFVVAPRVGTLIHLGKAAFLDLAVRYDVIGAEGLTLTTGLGLWIDAPRHITDGTSVEEPYSSHHHDD